MYVFRDLWKLINSLYISMWVMWLIQHWNSENNHLFRSATVSPHRIKITISYKSISKIRAHKVGVLKNLTNPFIFTIAYSITLLHLVTHCQASIIMCLFRVTDESLRLWGLPLVSKKPSAWFAHINNAELACKNMATQYNEEHVISLRWALQFNLDRVSAFSFRWFTCNRLGSVFKLLKLMLR